MLRILLLASLGAANAKFEVFKSWRTVDFAFENVSGRAEFLAAGYFVPENNMPLGMSLWRNRIFITVPRWRNGVAANLNYFLIDDVAASPILIPYPSWGKNNIRSPDSIVNIFRTRVDACDRLWGLDTGVDDILGEFKVLRPPRIFVIDLKTDEVLRSYNLKETDQKADSFFADLIIDADQNACDDAFAFFSDLSGYGMVIYSWKKNDSWRISHNYFHFDPLHGDYNVSGFNFQWTDGVLGMSLSAPQDNGQKMLYFHAMSGITEFKVSTETLKNPRTAQDYFAFQIAGKKGLLTQGPSSMIDLKTGINYFTQIQRNGIACWDTEVDLNPESFVLVGQNNETMVFPNDLAIDESSKKLLVLSDNLQKFQYSKFDPKEPNFFITAANLEDLTSSCRNNSKKNMH